ncbi:hypothetical protein NUSPORA_00051 [Nucleospora cyclopteri]
MYPMFTTLLSMSYLGDVFATGSGRTSRAGSPNGERPGSPRRGPRGAVSPATKSKPKPAHPIPAPLIEAAYYPEPEMVTEFDAFSTGALSVAYRKFVITNNNLLPEYYTCFITNPIRTWYGLEGFFTAIANTARDIDNIDLYENVRAKEVVLSIFNNAIILRWSVEELIQFTATAMHNMYSFNKFTEVTNDESKDVSRGLIQFTGETGYANLRNVGWTKKLSQLNLFSEESILFEMQAFNRFYYVRPQVSIIRTSFFSTFIQTTENLKPEEMTEVKEILSNCCLCGGIYSQKLFISMEATCKLIRRFRIYSLLSSYLSNTSNPLETNVNVSSRIIC